MFTMPTHGYSFLWNRIRLPLFTCLTILLFLGPNQVSAQALPPSKPNPDSLMQVLDTISNDSLRIENLVLLGHGLINDQPDTALTLLQQAYNQAVESGFIYRRKAEIQLLVASGYTEKNEFDRSSEIIFDALELYKSNQDSIGIGKCLQSLGRSYLEMRDFERGLNYTLRAYEILASKNDTVYLYPCLQNITQLYAHHSMIDSARYYHDKGIEYLDEHPFYLGRSSIHQSLGIGYRYVGAIDSSNLYFQLALKAAKNHPEKRGQILASISINFRVMDQPDSALHYIEQAWAIQERFPDDHWKWNLYSEYINIYEDLGDYKTALEYFKKFDTICSIVYDQERLDLVRDLEIQYEVREQEQQNEILSQKAELRDLQLARRNAWIIVLLLSLALGIWIAYAGVKRIRQRARHREVDLKQKALRSQMNPHFVYNALSSIQHIVYNNDKLFAVTNISIFAKLMRSVLNQSEKETVSVREEMETLDLYLSLEALRFEDRFNYSIAADENVPLDQYTLPPLLLQPLVENAIKHGLLNKIPAGGSVSIRIQVADSNLICHIEDDGVGRQKAHDIRSKQDRDHPSFATQSIKQRIELLNNQNKTKITYQTEDLFENGQPSGTRVTLIFPQDDTDV
ncbi:histidine kinase [bacterium SCSIO 12741]|nr:histidine kinase [bacterium SCSIO 12741]